MITVLRSPEPSGVYRVQRTLHSHRLKPCVIADAATLSVWRPLFEVEGVSRVRGTAVSKFSGHVLWMFHISGGLEPSTGTEIA